MRRLLRPVCRGFTSNAGILGLDIYFPRKFVSHRDLEVYDGVGEGKYTAGLGQTSFAFVDDREDSVSLMMNALHNLLSKYDIDPSDIGAMYVGTESAVDRSKSIKSYLLQVFEEFGSGNSNVEGVDNISACFGGTQALWNACYWIEAHQDVYDRYAVVVCGDCAGYKEPNARATSGAGAVAMLVGRDAPLRMDLQKKFFHFDHVYDFYKPDPSCLYPVVDGHLSNACYLSALDHCFTGGGFSLKDSSFVLLHSPYNKLVRKSVGFLEFLEHENSAGRGIETRVGEGVYTDCDLLDSCRVSSIETYNEKAGPGTLLPQIVGNSYSSSLYFALASLLGGPGSGNQLIGENIMAYSYGSGLASSVFEIECREGPSPEFSLDRISEILDLESRMEDRIEFSPEEFVEFESRNAEIFRSGIQNLRPEGSVAHLEDGAYYLEEIDVKFRRSYLKKEALDFSSLHYEVCDGVAWVTFDRPETMHAMDVELSHDLLCALTAAGDDPSVRVVVLTGSGRAFSAGGDVGSFYEHLEDAPSFVGEILEELNSAISVLQTLEKPVIGAINGVAAGAGMALAMAVDLAVAASSSMMVLAYTGIGVSPDGSSSYYLPRLVGPRVALELALLNRPLSAEEALELGIVNMVVPDDEFVEAVSALADRLAAGPTLAFANTRRLIRSSLANDFETQVKLEADSIVELAGTNDFKEGVTAFVQKRNPDFKGD